MAVIFAAATYALDSSLNRFPWFYHTDEPSKVDQVITGRRNLHHPELLLNSTSLLVRAFGREDSRQSVVETGRDVSAAFAAIAVGSLVLVAWLVRGMLAGAICGVLAASHPALFEFSHYMKEDCTLVAGISLTFLALAIYAKMPGWITALFCGIAAGLAASGKLAGTVMIAVCIIVIAATPMRRRWLAVALSLAAAVVVFVIINPEFFTNPVRAGLSWQGEISRFDNAVSEEHGFKFHNLSSLGTTISVPLLAAIAFWVSRRKWREQPAFLWALALFPLAYYLVLGFVPIGKERYLLPVFMMCCLLSSLGFAEMLAMPRTGWRAAAISLLVIGVGCHLYPDSILYREFQTDDRQELARFLKANVPPSDSVVCDSRVKLQQGREEGVFDFPQAILSTKLDAADAGDFTSLKAKGVHYAAVCEKDYHVFLRKSRGKGADFARRAAWYRQLFASGPPLFELKSGRVAYLHPGLRLYRIP